MYSGTYCPILKTYEKMRNPSPIPQSQIHRSPSTGASISRRGCVVSASTLGRKFQTSMHERTSKCFLITRTETPIKQARSAQRRCISSRFYNPFWRQRIIIFRLAHAFAVRKKAVKFSQDGN